MSVVVLIGLNSAAAEQDAKGSADHPLLTRMPDFRIATNSDKDFDRHEFLAQVASCRLLHEQRK